MTKYPELEAHFQRYVADGYAPDLFDLLVTAAPAAHAVARGDSLAGYCSREKTITTDQKADVAFLWGYANYLRDKSILPPVHQCTGDDFDQVRQLMHQLSDAVVRRNINQLLKPEQKQMTAPVLTDNEKLAIALANERGLVLGPLLILSSYKLLGLQMETATPFAIRYCANVLATVRTDEEWAAIHDDARAELDISDVGDINPYLAEQEENISKVAASCCRPKNRDLHNALLIGLSRVHTHWLQVSDAKKQIVQTTNKGDSNEK